MEYSLYENMNKYRQDQSFGITLGIIDYVNTEERTCSVATFGGSGSMEDTYIERCQWLSPDVNPEGDESGSIPRVGSIGLVFFVQSQAFIWGFLRPLRKGGIASSGQEAVTILEGDKIMSTVKGNRITVKRSGLIELYTSEALRRVMVPTTGTTMEVCKRYAMNCMEGGRINWEADAEFGTSLYRAEYLQSQDRAFIVTDEKGYVSDELLSRLTAGPAVPFFYDIQTPVFLQTISLAGEFTTSVTPPLVPGSPVGCTTVMSPTGAWSFKGGAGQQTTMDVGALGGVEMSVNGIATASISPEGDIALEGPVGSASIGAAGDIELANAMASVSMSATGDIEIAGPIATVKISAAGEVSVDTPQKMSVSAKAGVDIKAMGPVNIETVGPTKIKGTMVSIDGGSGVLEAPLTSPSTISPFTGTPLMPGSRTVKLSI